MNLGEAEKSLNYFADLLNMQSALLRNAVVLEAQAGSVGMAPQATENRQQLFTQLQASCKDAQTLSIILYGEMAKAAERLVCVPIGLAKVHIALNRLRQAEQQAQLLLEEQEKHRAKDSEPHGNATSIAIRKFLEKHEREEAERRRKRALSDPHN